MTYFTYQDYCKYKASVLSTYTNINETLEPYHCSNNCNEKISYSINDVHDKLYRDAFSNTDEFSLFLKQFLGIDVLVDKLLPYNSDFITTDYKNRHSDIIYKIKDEPIYFFLEHQSSIDYSISFRIFEYYSLILKSTIDFKHIKNKNYVFPSIIPVLLYTGNKKWDIIPNLRNKLYPNYFGKNHILDFKYDYINIFDYSIEELLNMNSMVSFLLAADKCKTSNELLNVLEKASSIIKDDKKASIRRLISNVYSNFIQNDMRDELLKKFKEGSDENMKTSWELIKEDFERIRQRDIEKGIKQTAINLLKNGVDISIIQKSTGLSIEEIKKLA